MKNRDDILKARQDRLDHISNSFSNQNELEKGKPAQIGEIREHGGKKMKKTPQGWVPAGDGKKDKIIKKNGKVLGHFGVNSAVNEFTLDKGIELNQLDDKLDKVGGITNSKKMDVWWGEWYFRKQELTERKEPGGFVQWRKELQNG